MGDERLFSDVLNPTAGLRILVSVFLDRRALNQLVKVYYVSLIPEGDAKRHRVYTGSGNRCPTSSLRERSCIPCTEVLVIGVYKLGERESLSQVSA